MLFSKNFILLGLITCFSFGFADPPSQYGPRAGIGMWASEPSKPKYNSPMHSMFGWALEILYASSESNFAGYAEGGFVMAAAEQGIFRPEAWGYFGVRGKNIGVGIGPYMSVYGLRIGFAPYMQLRRGNLRIPIIWSWVFMPNALKTSLTFGFNFGTPQ